MNEAPGRVTVRSVETLYRLADQRRLYAVVDTAGDRVAYDHLLTLGGRARCLYFGEEGARYAAIAPWLAEVDAPLCDWIGTTLAAHSPDWGVFVVSRAAPPAVARQLRRWLTVRDPDGEVVRFRFYDPRVLFDFLGACTTDELRAFFGSAVEAFATHRAVTDELWIYDRADAPVVLPTRRVIVAAPNPDATRAAAPVPAPRVADAPFPLGLRPDVQ